MLLVRASCALGFSGCGLGELLTPARLGQTIQSAEKSCDETVKSELDSTPFSEYGASVPDSQIRFD